jgi:hypothetical protein
MSAVFQKSPQPGQDNITSTYRLVPLKQHNSPPFVSSCQIIARVVEFDSGDYVRYRTCYVSMRLNTGERYKGYIGLKARRPKESLDVESELLTFCDVLHISLITKASDA